MSKTLARLGIASSLLLLVLVVVDFTLVSNQKSEKNEKGQVLTSESSPSQHYKFYLKDSNVLPGSTESKSNEYLTGAAVSVTNTGVFRCGEGGASYKFVEYDGLYKIICQESATMNIKISKSGYQTKYTSLPPYSGTIPIITLAKYVPPPAVPAETIKDILLPSDFKEAGSATTDLKSVSDTTKVENLTLDTKFGTIKFKEAVDLSASDTKEKFKKLNEYVETNVGKIAVDSVSLPVLGRAS